MVAFRKWSPAEERASLMIELSVESVCINLKTQQRGVILKALNQDRYMYSAR